MICRCGRCNRILPAVEGLPEPALLPGGASYCSVRCCEESLAQVPAEVVQALRAAGKLEPTG